MSKNRLAILALAAALLAALPVAALAQSASKDAKQAPATKSPDVFDGMAKQGEIQNNQARQNLNLSGNRVDRVRDCAPVGDGCSEGCRRNEASHLCVRDDTGGTRSKSK